MNKTIVLIGVLMVIATVLAGTASAITLDNLLVYYNFNADATDSLGANNGIVSGAANVGGFLGNAYAFDGTDDEIRSTNVIGISGDQNFSYSYWAYANDSTNSRSWIGYNNDTPGDKLHVTRSVSNNYYFQGGGANTNWATGQAVTTGAWVFHCVYYNSATSQLEWLVNNVRIGTGVSFADNFASVNDNIYIGNTQDVANKLPFNGRIDEVGIWGRTLSNVDCSDLYANGTGLTYPFGQAAASTFSITAFDIQSSTLILSFNATVNGLFFSTTNGTIATNITNGTANVTTRVHNYTQQSYTGINANSTLFRANLTRLYYVGDRGVTSTDEYRVETNNLTVNSSANATVYATFQYNGTDYAPTYINGTNQTTLVARYLVPAVGGTTTVSYNWLYNITTYSVLTTQFYGNNLTGSQVISPLNGTIAVNATVVTVENQTIAFTLNTTPNTTSAYASFVWNNTAYTITRSNGTNNVTFTAYFITPLLPTGTIVTYSWNYNLTGTNTVLSSHILSRTQTINAFSLDNCSINTVVSMNITLLNESNNLQLNGSMAGYFQAWISNPMMYREFNISWNGRSNYGLCIDQNRTYMIYGQLEYSSPNYATKTYYFINTTITNISQALSLYLTGGTTDVLMTVVDQNGNPVQDAYIYVQSYDITTNTYKTTEILKTGSDGTAIAHIVLTTTWYKFLIYYNGNLVLSTTPAKITSTTKTFQINTVTDYFTNYNTIQSVSCALTFTNSTRNFRFDFSDSTAKVTRGCLRVIKRYASGDTTINDTCVDSVGGTILININNSTGRGAYIGSSRLYIGSEQFQCTDPISVNDESRYQQYGLTGIFVTFMIVATLAMVGLWQPIVSILLMLIALLGSVAAGFFHLSWGVLVGVVIITFIVIYRLRQR